MSKNIKAYTIGEMTEILKVCKATIYREVERGNLRKPKKIGRVSVWTEEDIKSYLDDR